MPTVGQNSGGGTRISRLPNQLPEITPYPGLQLRMARSPVGPGLPRPLPSSFQKEENCQPNSGFPQPNPSVLTCSGKSAGLSPVRVSSGPSSQSQTERYQQGLAPESFSIPSRQEETDSACSSEEASSVDDSSGSESGSASSLSPSVDSDTHRRISHWLPGGVKPPPRGFRARGRFISNIAISMARRPWRSFFPSRNSNPGGSHTSA